MLETQVCDKILSQSDAIDRVSLELKWLLNEANNHQPPTKQFRSLFLKYKNVVLDAEKLSHEINLIEFKDKIMGFVYQQAAQCLVQRCYQGIFMNLH